MASFIPTLRRGVLVLAVTALAAFAPVVAAADPIIFNFDTLASGVTNGSINTYMNGILAGTGGTVAVTGAITNKAYNGDNHVVGPNGGATSATLGTTDNYAAGAALATANLHATTGDTWIKNNGVTTIAMTFTGIKIWQVSFDYEIFPDATCLTGSCGTGNVPDFTFRGTSATNVVTTGLHHFGIVPGQAAPPAGTVPTPGEPAPLATLLHSPNSGAVNNELTPQYLSSTDALTGAAPGTTLGSTNGADGVHQYIIFTGANLTKLEFIDWPVTIGIDNLRIILDVPEPGTLLLLGLGGFAISAFRLRRRR